MRILMEVQRTKTTGLRSIPIITEWNLENRIERDIIHWIGDLEHWWSSVNSITTWNKCVHKLRLPVNKILEELQRTFLRHSSVVNAMLYHMDQWMKSGRSGGWRETWQQLPLLQQMFMLIRRRRQRVLYCCRWWRCHILRDYFYTSGECHLEWIVVWLVTLTRIEEERESQQLLNRESRSTTHTVIHLAVGSHNRWLQQFMGKNMGNDYNSFILFALASKCGKLSSDVNTRQWISFFLNNSINLLIKQKLRSC